MPTPVINFFKGLTTQHVSAVAAICAAVAFWVGNIEPKLKDFEQDRQDLTLQVSKIADTFEKCRVEVAELKTEVKVQGAFLVQMESLKGEIRDLRQELLNVSKLSFKP